MVLKWQNKKPVTMLSIFHSDKTEKLYKKERDVKKPACIINYNKNMGGVDLKDRMLQQYLIKRKRCNK